MGHRRLDAGGRRPPAPAAAPPSLWPRRWRRSDVYHRLVRAFLSDHEVADYQLVDSQGATEGTVANLTAEAIADITSSGETLRANNLRILDEEPILRSQATLFAGRAALDDVRPFFAQLGMKA